MPSCVQMRAAVFGPTPGKPEEVDDARRDEAAALRQRMHLAVLDDLHDLGLDRLPDPRELLRLPVERELGDRRRRTPGSARPHAGTR